MAVKVIGAGLAGCEAAWQLAQAGIDVEFYEMKPKKFTPAHKYRACLLKFIESGQDRFSCRNVKRGNAQAWLCHNGMCS